jgi:hypothetical protein
VVPVVPAMAWPGSVSPTQTRSSTRPRSRPPSSISTPAPGSGVAHLHQPGTVGDGWSTSYEEGSTRAAVRQTAGVRDRGGWQAGPGARGGDGGCRGAGLGLRSPVHAVDPVRPSFGET